MSAKLLACGLAMVGLFPSFTLAQSRGNMRNRATDLRAIEFADWTDRGFRNLDHNKDDRIDREEWHFNPNDFRRADTNRDGVITRGEFLGYPAESRLQQRSPAYRAGYERGRQDGIAAGREDRQRNQGFEPTGQRELENADAGYEPRFGARPEYQDGYRAGFAAGYPEGYDSSR